MIPSSWPDLALNGPRRPQSARNFENFLLRPFKAKSSHLGQNINRQDMLPPMEPTALLAFHARPDISSVLRCKRIYGRANRKSDLSSVS